MFNFLGRSDSRLREIRAQWSTKGKSKLNKKERELFDVTSKEKSEVFMVDDQTWHDLHMDDVYKEMNTTYSVAGEHMLYKILREPLLEDKILLERNKVMNYFEDNLKKREDIAYELSRLGKQKNAVVSLIWDEVVEDNKLRIIYNLLGIIPLALIISMFFVGFFTPLIYLLLVLISYMMIHYKVKKKLEGKQEAIRYLGAIIKTAGRVSKLKADGIKEYQDILAKNYSKCKSMVSYALMLGNMQGIDMVADYVNILFLAEERAYYSIIRSINRNKEELKSLYTTLGEVDALLATASYRASFEATCEPDFTASKQCLEAIDLKHPLLEKPVPNSLVLNKKGLVITGSNMSGKSTFLRTVGVNAILAQTMYTCIATSYKGDFFKIISSISPDDNLLGGKSYYLSEAEALLRIIKQCNDKIPTLCMIDEIFRGTNPVERVAAATVILKYLAKHNAIALVATHDLELTRTAEARYDCYYFREDINEKGLTFDYLMKKGVSPTRNAVRILKYIGYPEEIINDTEDMIAAE